MQQNTIWLAAIGVTGLAIALLLLIRSLLFSKSEDAAKDRLGDGADSQAEILILDRREPTGLGRIDNAFERMMFRTGLDMTPPQALALMALLGVALGGVLYLWRFQIGLSVLGLALGIGIPLMIFWYMQSRYQYRLQEQLPDAFYLLARSLRAGMSLEQAIQAVGEQGVPPLAEEFKRCTGQLRLGLTMHAALLSMARRVQLTDFNSFVSAVGYFQQTGGNLALVLDRLAASTRDRNQFRGHFMAVTAQARISAAFLGLVPFMLLLGYTLFDPDHVQLFFASTRGWAMLGVALVLDIVGVIWLYMLLRVEY